MERDVDGARQRLNYFAKAADWNEEDAGGLKKENKN